MKIVLNQTQKLLLGIITFILFFYLVTFLLNRVSSNQVMLPNSVSVYEPDESNISIECNQQTLGTKLCKLHGNNYLIEECKASMAWEYEGKNCDSRDLPLCVEYDHKDAIWCVKNQTLKCFPVGYQYVVNSSEFCGPSLGGGDDDSNSSGGSTDNDDDDEVDTNTDQGNNNSNNNNNSSTKYSTFPSVNCTYSAGYIDPATGKKGPKKCKSNKFGEVKICQETQRPKADGSGGNGVCAEKKTAAGESCKFNIQCGIEEDYAPGLPFEYELRNLQMRCEKRNTAEGKLTETGFCLPSLEQPIGTDPESNPISCGFNGETDAERDAYCVAQFEVYSQIREGIAGTDHKDPFVSLKVPQNAYCHKVKDAAGNEDKARFECRLKRKAGSECKAAWGNACL